MSDFNVLKEYYIRYLKQVRGNSDSSVNHYIGALQTISKYLVERGKIVNTIYEIDNCCQSQTKLYQNIKAIKSTAFH